MQLDVESPDAQSLASENGMRFAIWHPRVLTVVVVVAALAIGSYAAASSSTPAIGPASPAPTPTSGEVSTAQAAVAAEVAVISGSQDWDVANARYAYHRVDAKTVERDGVRFEAVFASPISSDGPWHYFTCQGTWAWDVTERVSNIYALEFVVAPDSGRVLAMNPISAPSAATADWNDPEIDSAFLATHATGRATDVRTGRIIVDAGPGITPSQYDGLSCPEGFNDD